MKPLVYKKAKRVRRPPPIRMKLHITKGDTVQVISGEEKGKQGQGAPGLSQDRPDQGRRG